jgi:hypothetical protein
MKRDKVDKSIDTEALGATIGLLENTLSKSQAGRTQELMQKGATLGLTSDESEELRKSLAGDLEDGVSNEIAKSMDADEDLNKSVQMDVSGFLGGLQSNITDALQTIGSKLEKGFKENEDTNFVLAKALLDVCKVTQAQAELVKSLETKVESFGRIPAGAPRAARNPAHAEALRKGFGDGGEEGGGLSLNKQDILETINDMSMHKSYAEVRQDLGVALAQYESTNEISPALLKKVVDFKKGLQG